MLRFGWHFARNIVPNITTSAPTTWFSISPHLTNFKKTRINQVFFSFSFLLRPLLCCPPRFYVRDQLNILFDYAHVKTYDLLAVLFGNKHTIKIVRIYILYDMQVRLTCNHFRFVWGLEKNTPSIFAFHFFLKIFLSASFYFSCFFLLKLLHTKRFKWSIVRFNRLIPNISIILV